MAHTRDQFQDALSYISRTNPITVTGERYQDNIAMKLWDDGYTDGVRTSHVDITPDEATITQALADLAAEQVVQSGVDTLVSLTKEDMLIYYRDALVSAAGNGATIATIYTQVLAYQTQNQKLTDLMLSLRTIEETGSGVAIDTAVNAGKARYLQLFQTALSLWLI